MNNSTTVSEGLLVDMAKDSYFFRDSSQMNLLKNTVLPALIAAKRAENNLSLRVWSAGCASGEELYSIAIMLHDLLPDLKDWTIHLLGTDIDIKQLKKAIDGFYTDLSMRDVDDDVQTAWFTKSDNQFRLIDKILSMTEFLYLNLNDSFYPSIINGTNAQDLILCRNALIYFDEKSTNKIMRRLNQSLVEGGYLVLGSSDPINLAGTDLIFHHHAGLLFQRPSIKEYSTCMMKSAHLASQQSARDILQKLSIPINTHVISQLLDECRWQDTLDAIEIYKNNQQSAFLNSAEATALANLGMLTRATTLCEESLKLDANNKDTHILFAMILVELNNLSEAENELKSALFLDKNYVIAHFQLGLLCLRMHKIEEGIKSLELALTIATMQNTEEQVPGALGLKYGKLIDILKHEIELYVPVTKMMT